MLALEKSRLKGGGNKMYAWIWIRSFIPTKYVTLGRRFNLSEAHFADPQNRD